MPDFDLTDQTPDNLNLLDSASDNSANEPEPEEVSVSVNMTNRTGQRYSGVFILRVPTVQDDCDIAKVRVKLTSGVPLSAFEPLEAELFDAMATCVVMFKPKSTGDNSVDPAPEWWYKLSTKDAPADLYLQLAALLRDHAARYFRHDPGKDRAEAGRCVVEIKAIGR